MQRTSPKWSMQATSCSKICVHHARNRMAVEAATLTRQNTLRDPAPVSGDPGRLARARSGSLRSARTSCSPTRRQSTRTGAKPAGFSSSSDLDRPPVMTSPRWTASPFQLGRGTTWLSQRLRLGCREADGRHRHLGVSFTHSHQLQPSDWFRNRASGSRRPEAAL